MNTYLSLKEIIKESCNKNKDQVNVNILSVSNSLGFIKQSEQFEAREVASSDTSNYKIVNRNQYAYNPARINVGSIARLIGFDSGIVSPMYTIFELDSSQVMNTYFDIFLQSISFKRQLLKNLEGNVRQCLTFSGMQSMSIKFPFTALQREISKRLDNVDLKLAIENEYLELLKRQKKYLLDNMFI